MSRTPRDVELSVILPCLNEEANVLELAARLRDSLSTIPITWELVLVDDGSTDSTWLQLSQIEAADPDRTMVIRHESTRGIQASWTSGMEAAHGRLACVMDSDLQNPPEAVPALWRALSESRDDFAQGTRSSIEWDGTARWISSRVLNMILNLVYGDNARDNKSGFVMGPRGAFLEAIDLRKRYRYPHTFVRVGARSKGYTFCEVETLFQPRRAGQSFIAGWKSVRATLWVLLDVLRGVGEFGRGLKAPRLSQVAPKGAASPTPHYSAGRRVRRRLYFSTMRLHAWQIRPAVRLTYLQLQQSQWLARDELREFQSRRLARLLAHAYTHVPFYRRRLDEGSGDPRGGDPFEVLSRMPLLEKADVRRHLYFDLFADTHEKRRMHKIATSGSTGEPFVTYADREQLEVRFATTLRALEWTGWRFGDRQVRLWHQTLGMSRVQVVKERLDAILLRRRFIPAFEISDANLMRMARRIDKFRPFLIDGYAESLNFLASYVSGTARLAHPPRAVMSSAQTLPDGTRAQISAGLGAEVFDKYGAREFSGIAYECDAHQGHHVMDESYLVEVLRDGRPAQPGEIGEVVVTDLNNFSVPLIRYRIGDLAVAMDDTPCPCGRGLSRIGSIHGRTQALVHCANGRWIPGTFFAHFFKEYDALVRAFQVRQSETGSFSLLIVRAPRWSEAGWQLLLDDLRTVVGEATTIGVDYVEEIPLLRTGKRTPVISTVRVDFQELTRTPEADE